MAGDVVDAPTRNDVLLGRGVPYQDYAGNVRLSKFIEIHRDRYFDPGAARGEKKRICDEMIVAVHQSQGRFLKRSEDGETWIVADYEEGKHEIVYPLEHFSADVDLIQSFP
jgi:hypothetical protein